MTTPYNPGGYDFGQLQADADSLVTTPGGAFSTNARDFRISDQTPSYLGSPFTVLGKKRPIFQPYAQARLIPTEWSEKETSKFVAKGLLAKAPGFSADMGMPEILAAWDELVMASININQRPGQEWTPWDVLDSYSNNEGKFGTIRRGDWEYDIATGEKVKYVGPRTKTRTDKRVDLSNPGDVKALTTQMLSELLGRAPTADELAKYRSSINSYERAAPTITTTTETLGEMGEVVATEQEVVGGVSTEGRAALISEEAKKAPEYGKFQAGTTYFDALMQMVSGGF